MTASLSACLANVDHDRKHVLDPLESFRMTISRTMWDNVGLRILGLSHKSDRPLRLNPESCSVLILTPSSVSSALRFCVMPPAEHFNPREKLRGKGRSVILLGRKPNRLVLNMVTV